MEVNRYQKNDGGIFGLEAGNIWNPFDSCFVFQHFIFGVKKYFKKRKKRGYRNRYNLIDRPSGSCSFCEIDKDSMILAHLKFTKHFHEFELMPQLEKC